MILIAIKFSHYSIMKCSIKIDIHLEINIALTLLNHKCFKENGDRWIFFCKTVKNYIISHGKICF